MSVLVPLSMFATDPDAFRAQFLEERGKRFVRLEDAITKGEKSCSHPLVKVARDENSAGVRSIRVGALARGLQR